jgi:acetylglutamate kinase
MRVIKLGGSLLEDAQRRAAALAGVARRWARGERLVLVHGGGKHVDAQLAKLGIARKTHAGLRVTDDATLDVVVGVLAGNVNKMLVAELSKLGVRAAGLSGADAGTIRAVPHEPVGGVELGHVGRVTHASSLLVDAMLESNILPVVSSIAAGPEGTLLNVNADTAAAALAVGVGADFLVFLTDVEGLLDGSGNVVRELRTTDAEALLQSGVVSGGMRPKLLAALGALNEGVAGVTIGEGTRLVAGSASSAASQPATGNRQPATHHAHQEEPPHAAA